MSPGTRGLLLDSDVLAEIRRTRPNPTVVAFLRRRSHRTLFLSALSLGELKGLYPHRETDRWLDELVERFEDHVLDVDPAVARAWAGRSSPESILRLGQRSSTSWTGAAVEGLIAATAEVHGLTVVSAKADVFRSWGVDAQDPWREA
ncbi:MULTISPECIES: type II toxin-antitoxin system VapC family toxin [Kocuria]|uniref:type II toxin-antitoxin system VapC family toxin n=1 Tax=Kocuria TaxID=57493 RepID=UPI000660A1BC|nr:MULTISPECIES: type II toxin-antitoxin system VapC family toxin [Kocuria]RUQ21279.1 type II toxin-antitoxin system VapC family toxin [Kocuria sp. HSID16901]